MKKYLNRLNWTGFTLILCVCGLGALSRTQDKSLYESFLVFLIIGLPISLIFLFIGMEPKEK